MKLPIPAIAALVTGLAAGTYLSPGRTAEPPHQEVTDSATVAAVATPTVPVTVSELPAPGPVVEDSTDLQSLSDAVAGLSVRDAAPMVARLSDDEALGVLKTMPLARASEILEAMPRDRGSELSRLLLLAGTGT